MTENHSSQGDEQLINDARERNAQKEELKRDTLALALQAARLVTFLYPEKNLRDLMVDFTVPGDLSPSGTGDDFRLRLTEITAYGTGGVGIKVERWLHQTEAEVELAQRLQLKGTDRTTFFTKRRSHPKEASFFVADASKAERISRSFQDFFTGIPESTRETRPFPRIKWTMLGFNSPISKPSPQSREESKATVNDVSESDLSRIRQCVTALHQALVAQLDASGRAPEFLAQIASEVNAALTQPPSKPDISANLPENDSETTNKTFSLNEIIEKLNKFDVPAEKMRYLNDVLEQIDLAARRLLSQLPADIQSRASDITGTLKTIQKVCRLPNETDIPGRAEITSYLQEIKKLNKVPKPIEVTAETVWGERADRRIQALLHPDRHQTHKAEMSEFSKIVNNELSNPTRNVVNIATILYEAYKVTRNPKILEIYQQALPHFQTSIDQAVALIKEKIELLAYIQNQNQLAKLNQHPFQVGAEKMETYLRSIVQIPTSEAE